MSQIELYLTKPQLNKFNKHLPIQLNKSQIEGTNGDHKVSLEMTPILMKKLSKNLKAGKGFRFKKPKTEGGMMEEVSIQEVVGPVVKKTGGRMVKGSQEAKDYMAAIRNKRKKGGLVEQVEEQGGSLKSIIKTVSKGVKTARKVLKPISKAAKPFVTEAITDGIVTGVDLLTKTPLGSASKPLIKKGVKTAYKAITGVGMEGSVKKDTCLCHDKHLSHHINGAPLSLRDIRNKKVGGSFLALHG